MQQFGVLGLFGLALGAIGAFALSRALSAWTSDLAETFGTVNSPVLLVGAAARFVAVVLAACCVPASRAVRIDPASTLRAE